MDACGWITNEMYSVNKLFIIIKIAESCDQHKTILKKLNMFNKKLDTKTKTTNHSKSRKVQF